MSRSSPMAAAAASRPEGIAHNIIAHVDPYEERDYRKGDARVRANPLLVKIQTGKVKATTYDLPPAGFTYGRRDGLDDEGVKEVVNSWQHHTPPAEAIPGRDFVKLNRTAVVKGAVNSKDIAAFRTTHDARLKSAATITKGSPVKLDPNFTFGRPSKPSTPIHDVLNNTFQRNAIVAARRAAAFAEAEREAKENAKSGKFGQSQHTRASLGHMKIRAPPAREPFKLDKFKQVGPRIGYTGLSTQPAQAYNEQQQQQFDAASSSSRYEEEKSNEAEQGQQQYEQF